MIEAFKRLRTDQRPGQPIRASDARETNETVNRLTQGVAPPSQFTRDSGGGSSLLSCSIVSIHRNHLVCKTKGGSTINVARPLATRSPDSELIQGVNWVYSAYSPDFQQRKATGIVNAAQVIEDQIIMREYAVFQGASIPDDYGMTAPRGIIRATRITGGTGVPEAPYYEEVHTDRTWYRKTPAA